jgi:hypothetical protein
MKFSDVLIEQHLSQSKLLVESVCQDLTPEQTRIVEGIYKAYLPLIEATLTADQINQLFTSVEKNATAAGGNRTAIGQGKDTLEKANKIINDAGKWLQDTKPVKAFDQKFEDLKTKVSQKFPELAQNLSAMGEWAKANPGKTAAIIGVLTAVASLAAGPVGGAIAGQVLRGSSELLKGEKLSTAIGKGAKAAALGGLAGLGAEALGNVFGQGVQMVRDNLFPGAHKLFLARDATGLGFHHVSVIGKPEDLAPIKAAWEASSKAYNAGDLQGSLNYIQQAQNLADKLADPAYAAQIASNRETRAAITDAARAAIQGINAVGAAAQGAITATAGQEQPKQESRRSTKLSVLEVRAVINSVVLSEGPMWDKVKGKAQQIGTNLTTKVTADKLSKAWQAAGSPMDSDAVMQIIVNAGVPQEVVQQTFGELNIGAAPEQAAQPAGAGKLTVKQINQIIPTLRMRDLLSLQKTVDARLNKGAA